MDNGLVVNYIKYEFYNQLLDYNKYLNIFYLCIIVVGVFIYLMFGFKFYIIYIVMFVVVWLIGIQILFLELLMLFESYILRKKGGDCYGVSEVCR